MSSPPKYKEKSDGNGQCNLQVSPFSDEVGEASWQHVPNSEYEIPDNSYSSSVLWTNHLDGWKKLNIKQIMTNKLLVPEITISWYQILVFWRQNPGGHDVPAT